MSEFSSVRWDKEPEEYQEVPRDHQFEDTEANGLMESRFDPPESSSSAGKGVETDTIWFKCDVGEPQKEQSGSQNPYITYLVTTETNSPSFQNRHATVRRRFSDFVYLFNSLLNDYPACAIPPLPDKQRLEYLKGDRFGTEFTLRRACSLNRFLTRIGNHPSLKKSKTFYAFLESGDWNAYKKNKESKIVVQDGGVFEGISDTFLNAFSKVNTQSKELIEVKERADKLAENLGSIERAFSRAMRHQGDLVHDLEEFATQNIKLASLEPKLGLEVSEFARGIQEFSRELYHLREKTDSDYIVSLRDMESYVQSLKGLIKQREQKQLDYEALTEYLNRSQVDRNNLQAGGGTNFLRSKVEDLRGVDHEQSRQHRIQKLDQRIGDLTREVANAKVTSETFEECAINEVQVFDGIKYREMKDTMSSLADSHITFYQKLITDWEDIYKALDKEPSNRPTSPIHDYQGNNSPGHRSPSNED
ncbi:sorting nexin-4 [Trichomonascus vanleenenianus]|uniref:Snx4p n=1 Tax=Trichomonascus vanleenenianus TaxID=2268995 RepID=UPI003ECA3CF3